MKSKIHVGSVGADLNEQITQNDGIYTYSRENAPVTSEFLGTRI